MKKKEPNHQKSILWQTKNKFSNAFKGLFTATREFSLIVHFIITAIVIGLGIWLKIDYIRWAIILIVMGIVIGFELINTIVENFVDLLSFEYNIKAKKIKDICAAATLLNLILAVAIGLLILLPPLVEKIELFWKASQK